MLCVSSELDVPGNIHGIRLWEGDSNQMCRYLGGIKQQAVFFQDKMVVLLLNLTKLTAEPLSSLPSNSKERQIRLSMDVVSCCLPYR